MSGGHPPIRCRGLDFHVPHWGGKQRPQLVLVHGWGDCGETFAPLLSAWSHEATVAAPDMRGFGRTAHTGPHYWFADYIADLDALLQALNPDQPVALVGHSMGAQIASLYAGVRPERVSHLVVLDGLFLPDTPPELAPKRYRTWLHQLQEPPGARIYPDFDTLAERIRTQHPALNQERALEVAQAWAVDTEGGVRLRMDPHHRMRGPLLFKAAESKAVWREVTAPTLFVDGEQSAFAQAIDQGEREERRACFRHREERVIAGAGHMLHFDAPNETTDLVGAWLKDQGWPGGGTMATAQPDTPA